MSANGGNWGPSPRELRLLWYLRLVTRYVVGAGGLVWAMVTDHLDPILLMILGAVATSTDVAVFARDLFKAAKEQTKALEAEAQKEAELERERQKGSDE